MPSNTDQPKKTNEKWLIGGIGALLLVMMLPSVLLLAKIAIGLIMTAIATIAVKIFSKTISNALEKEKADPDQAAQKQSKVINLLIGVVSVLAGGLSLLIIAQTGLIAACVAVIALALYKNEEIEKYIGIDNKLIDNKLDEIADYATDLIVSSVEKPYLYLCRVAKQ